MNQPEWKLRKSIREGWLTLVGPYTGSAIKAIKNAVAYEDREWCSSQAQRFFRVRETTRETVEKLITELQSGSLESSVRQDEQQGE
jgi:hypothetical protein